MSLPLSAWLSWEDSQNYAGMIYGVWRELIGRFHFPRQEALARLRAALHLEWETFNTRGWASAHVLSERATSATREEWTPFLLESDRRHVRSRQGTSFLNREYALGMNVEEHPGRYFRLVRRAVLLLSSFVELPGRNLEDVWRENLQNFPSPPASETPTPVVPAVEQSRRRKLLLHLSLSVVVNRWLLTYYLLLVCCCGFLFCSGSGGGHQRGDGTDNSWVASRLASCTRRRLSSFQTPLTRGE